MENGLTFIQRIREAFEGKEVDIRTYSPLTLAYIGDSIYDLVIRTVVVMRGNAPANKLHHYTIRYVNATAQALLLDALLPKTYKYIEILYTGKEIYIATLCMIGLCSTKKRRKD